MPTEPGIAVVGVRRAFGTVHAVRDVTFTAAPGSVTGLIGPNGAGKTTLLLLLASLLQPDGGSIRILGLDPATDTARVRSLLGWMPDTLGSWTSLSCRTSLTTSGRLYGLPKPAAAARAAELLDLVGLAEFGDRPTRVLSRGQKQKLSLARALVHRPRVLLLDEPASGLDPAARVELRLLLRDLATDGCTILVSSHDLAELEEVTDDAVFMAAGETVTADRVQRAQSRVRDWRIRSLDEAALDRALAGRTDVRPERGARLVPVDGERAAADLLAELVRAGVPVTDFGPALGELETTFLELERSGA
ncbi:MAG TPA: ABC transporter ATP-binding protein [Amnibacterium sp.]|nr:ABC transporter ATP-binding protein [Amnibacterium sp.]